MGKSTNYVLGYGIRIEDINGKTAYSVLKLIQAAPKYEKEVFDHLEEARLHVPKDAELMFLRLEEILQRVILEREGLELVIAYNDDNEETFLLYPPSYPWKRDDKANELNEDPWDMPDKDKSSKERDIVGILVKYLTFLTSENIPVDYHSPENGG